ncbi:hypothetical protein MD535_22255 [Vibrio sp. ZSDZ65]|uniref:Uncharacterized protein n=1 Tax=Vibrio qingdaonensis TaxID=2829491 RepID=A0A9X3CSM7_9VIBR|nr:hypothetical protein [Vibrio qingdaonensis]MCW8348715.1 hypothetical protein [Vibrio qingdaonensis]
MHTTPFDTTALPDMDIPMDNVDNKEIIHLKKDSAPPACSVITRRRIEDILEEQALRKQWEL